MPDLSNFSNPLSIIGGVLAIVGMIASFFTFLLGKKNKGKIIALTLLCALAGGAVLWYAQSTTVQASTWTTALEDFAPICDDVGNATWVVSGPVRANTVKDCSNGSGVSLSTSSEQSGAEIDLDKVNGQNLNQLKFDVTVQITFPTTRDANLFAGLVVQTPQQGPGGYTLVMNNTGYWKLFDNAGNKQASQGQTVSSHTFALEMRVQNDKLTAELNGRPILGSGYADALNSVGGAIGLVVVGTIQSSVLFSNFALKD